MFLFECLYRVYLPVISLFGEYDLSIRSRANNLNQIEIVDAQAAVLDLYINIYDYYYRCCIR